jgi:hypothetical protein
MPAKKKSQPAKPKKTKSSRKKTAASSVGRKSAAGAKSGKSTKKTAPVKNAGKKASRKTSKKAAKKATGKESPAGVASQAVQPVFVINMIPRALSAESHQDSEPHLTVNPSNPLQIVGTAFTPDPGGGANAPIYVSMDGGNTWTLNSIVPSVAGARAGTSDITTAFNKDASRIYAGILRSPSGNQEFLRANNFNAPKPMTILESRRGPDQPFTHAITIKSGTNKSKDRVYIGNNDLALAGFVQGGKTATIDQSLDAATGTPKFRKVRIEVRTTAGQDGAQVRPVAHADGTVYAVFYRWRSMTGTFSANTMLITSADVVVVRDDNGGNGNKPYQSLVDPDDGLAGMRVVKGISFPFMSKGTAATGQQRLGGSLSIAVDPSNSSTVYLSWADKPAGSSAMQTLHVCRSLDRGTTWTTDLLSIPSATNGALAINSNGKVAYLYQEFKDTQGDPRWVTHVRRTIDGINWDDLILANVSAVTPSKDANGFDPYIGDYVHIVTIGKDFYGVFSASNIPNLLNFPNGVKYQRNADFNTQTLLRLDNTTAVLPSIDPFFFKLTE